MSHILDSVILDPKAADVVTPEDGEAWYNDTLHCFKMRVSGTGNLDIAAVPMNLSATTDPGVNDDTGVGYAIGSRWVNVTLDKEFVCVDVTAAAAVWIQTTSAGATDAAAIHDNVAGEISVVTEKVTPVAGDFILIEDSAAANAKKRIQIGNLPGGAAAPILSRSITIESPTATEDLSVFFTNLAITITEIRAVVRGSTPSVTWTIRHGTDRSAAGAQVVTGGTTTTSQTTGSDVTSFNDATIIADSFIWLETTAKTGTVAEMSVTIVYTED